jgi:hypothetical protein
VTLVRGAAAAALLALSLAACGNAKVITPNDPEYARSGAPRAGEAPVSPENAYGRIMGPGDSSGPN